MITVKAQTWDAFRLQIGLVCTHAAESRELHVEYSKQHGNSLSAHSFMYFMICLPLSRQLSAVSPVDFR